MLSKERSSLGFVEFISIMALMIALTALSIDAMLPALTEIGRDLKVSNTNDTQLVISVIFLGTAVGQLACGPLSDSYGRKPLVFAGITIFIIGSLLCIFASEFSWMLWGRLLQGVGLGAPRVISTAIIRDLYQGREMARVMSYVMTIFILVPVLAPAIGQLILFVASWRMIFTMLLIMALLVLCWFMIRQPETLPPTQRAQFSAQQLINSVSRVLRNPVTLGYTITAGLVSGPFRGIPEFDTANLAATIWVRHAVPFVLCRTFYRSRKRFTFKRTTGDADWHALDGATRTHHDEHCRVDLRSARLL
jgi:DHA1 family bicyclomycin/chloramphenicol resistance-like MFS transporter